MMMTEKIRDVYGLPPAPPIETAEESPESGPVKPGKTK
jgi:hypothetical protein